MLILARDRFDDSTYAVDAHHHNQTKVRAMLDKYEVKDVQVPKGSEKEYPHFMPETSFYSVLRARVKEYLD